MRAFTEQDTLPAKNISHVHNIKKKMYSRKKVFTAACMGMLLFGICLITLGSIIPDLKVKIGLDDLSSGALFSILPFGILTGSLLFGPFCDRFGYKLMLVLSALLM